METKQKSKSHTRNLGKAGAHFYLTDRDRQILYFLWRWKIASTATVHQSVGNSSSPYSTYKALERLERNKFIESRITYEYNFSSWCLTDRGFSIIRESLGDLSQDGYQSENHWHDRNVVALHLGEWPSHNLQIAKHFTEQEMRRYALDYYPEWVPKLKNHRPDGYSQIKNGTKDRLVAFEVEIWAKAISIYETTLRYYDLIKEIDRVLWLYNDPLIIEYIKKAKSNINDESRNFHLFVKQSDYMNSGWDAEVTNERSERVNTFRGIMQELCGDRYGKHVENKWGHSKVSVHYDTRKIIGKKRT